MENPKINTLGAFRDTSQEYRKLAASQRREEQFSLQHIPELEAIEREKSVDEKQVCKVVNDTTNRILEWCGLLPVDVPSKNVHLIKKDEWPEKAFGGHALYRPDWQGIAIQDLESLMQMGRVLLHEMNHMKMLERWQVIVSDPQSIKSAGGGLVVFSRDRKTRYLNILNEGLNEELTRIWLPSLLKDPVFAQEIERTKQLRRNNWKAGDNISGRSILDPETFTLIPRPNPQARTMYVDEHGTSVRGTLDMVWYSAREKERSVFRQLVSKICDRNRDQLPTYEDALKVFAKAAFGGNLKPVGRLIDKTFGPKTFATIVEFKDDIQELRKFVQAL